jgi:hypothetical protein
MKHAPQSESLEQRPSRGIPWVRTVCSFPVLIAFVLALLSFLVCRSRFVNPDLWLQLKVGEGIWNSRSLAMHDQYSYTSGHHAWPPHEWLSTLMMYGAYRLGGYQGLLLCFCAVGALVFILLYAHCSMYSQSPGISSLGAILAWFFATVGLSLRPLVLGHLFLVAELFLLHLARSRDRRWLWGLPPLFALWVNCHGSWIFGLLALGAAAASSFICVRMGGLVSDGWPEGRPALCAAAAASAAALFVNPIGAKLVAYPADVLLHQADNLNMAKEWLPLDVHDPRGIGLFAAAGVFALLFLLRRVSVRLEELLLLALGFAAALRHVRMLFAFGILIAPILCRLLADARNRRRPLRENHAVNAMLILTSIAVMALAFPTVPQIEQQIEREEPVAAVQFIRRAGLSGPMLNEYAWGGYLIWSMPEQRVFIDSRLEIYDWTGVLKEYARWSTLQEPPHRLLDQYGIRYCLLRRDAPVAFVMPYVPGWQQVYADHLAVIFARR